MFSNISKLLESLKFRFKSIFEFKNLSPMACFYKTLLLIFLGTPFVFIEILGLVFAICSCIPIVGIIFLLTVCLLCDLISSFLFYLIMLPNRISTTQNIKKLTQKKLVYIVKLTEVEYQDVYSAISWCFDDVNENTQKKLDTYKDKLFLNILSGHEGLNLQIILINIKNYTNDSCAIYKLEKAINILEEKIYKPN